MIHRGKTPKYVEESDVLVFAQKCNLQKGGIDLNKCLCLDTTNLKKWTTEDYLHKNDIVINSTGTGTLGRVGFFDIDSEKPVVPDTHVTVVRVSDKETYSKWVYYFLKYSQNYLISKGHGSTKQQELATSEIKKIEIPLPSYAYQENGAHHLDSIQSAIDNKKQQFQQLDELVKSKFVEMFGDVSLNDKNFDTEIGKNLFKFSSGKFLSAEFRLESGIPVYGGNGIAWYTEKPLIEYSTIIIGRVGAYCGNVKLVTEPVWITDNALFIKEFKTSRFNLQFLIKLMENINFAKYAGKVAQPKITQGPLEEQVYIIPPIEFQTTFAEYVQKIDSAKSIIKTQLADLQELLDSKMDEYFGE